MRISAFGLRILFTVALVLAASSLTAWVQHVRAAESPAQIGVNSPLPVFVTNPVGPMALPEGFHAGSRWRFTTWTMPSVVTWSASVNKTSGAWANLTITTEDRVTYTRWYFIPGMPGSWEQQ